MAKRRCKNKAKRGFVGQSRKLNINRESLIKSGKMEDLDSVKDGIENINNDPQCEVQVTENEKLFSEVTETENNANNGLKLTELSQNNVNKLKEKKSNNFKSVKKQMSDSDGNGDEEVLIFPTEKEGETCIDVQCGPNQAYMVLAKLCVGSRGACINFSDKWLTPNEFQLVSGRETAKDWKRSIRHKGRSLKLLIAKGLITVQSISPKKASAKLDKKAKEKVVVSEGGNVETKEAQATTNVTEPQICEQIQKKRGRKPKKHRGRRPAEQTDGVQKTDKARVMPEHAVGVFSDVNMTKEKQDKQIDATDNNLMTQGAHIEHTPDVEDTRTEDERRLDEFVKSLKLKKSTASTPTAVVPSSDFPLTAPVITPPTTIDDKECQNGDIRENFDFDVSQTEVDPEMPVLQKEADVVSNYEKPMDISVPVDALTSTVTPPPTPPGDHISIEQKIGVSENEDTFKSTLSSPSVGLKLTINREKVKSNSDIGSVVKTENNKSFPDSKCMKDKTTSQIADIDEKAKIQTLLLQDALQSAKKYKEQLQQSRQTSPVKTAKPTTLNVPMQSLLSNSSQHVSPKYSHKMDSHLSKLPVETEQHLFKHEDVRDNRLFTNSVNSNLLTSSADDMRRMSLPEMMSMMTSMDRSLPFMVDQKELAMLSTQELQQKYDMLNFMLAQRHMTAQSSASSLLYQQFLMSQLYNTCNLPAMLVPGAGSSLLSEMKSNHVPCSTKRSDSHSAKYSSLTSPLSRHSKRGEDQTQHKTISSDSSQLWRPSSQSVHNSRMSDGHANNKRKFIEVDTDGALDLSIKKPKHMYSYPSLNKKHSVLNYDSPLDFSVKQTSGINHSKSNIAHSAPHNFDSNIYTSSSYRNSTSSTASSRKQSGKGCCGCRSGGDIWSWSVEQVCSFLKSVDGCSAYVKTFHDQGISGRMLPYLTLQHLTRTLGMNSGPALSLMQAVESKCREKQSPATSPCMSCASQKTSFPVHVYS